MKPSDMARYADQLRYTFDLLVSATDERLSDEDRADAAMEIASRSGFNEMLRECRETWRDIANRRTDGCNPPEGWDK